MVASRTRPAGSFSGPLLLSAICAGFAPSPIGYQDLAGFFLRQPIVSEGRHEHLLASPFGAIHVATFSFVRPLGTALSVPLATQPVSFDPQSLDVKTWSADEPTMARPALPIEYPTVNRRLKGDRLPSLPQSAPSVSNPESLPAAQPVNAPASHPSIPPPPSTWPRPKDAERKSETTASLPGNSVAPALQDKPQDAEAEDDSPVVDRPPEIPRAAETGREETQTEVGSPSFFDESPAERNERLYFGVTAMGLRGALQQWEAGAEPVAVSPAADSDIKVSALGAPVGPVDEGETVAAKDDASHFESPAERLGLSGKPRAKAEKCLADAVYFEARGEPIRGQMAVAQVVMNRVFSGRYPNNVCGVVYQNANRRLACQFTFACEGKNLSRIDEPEMWAQAKRIAKDTLDGKIWLAEVGHATHYHAYWVHPSWVHEMARVYKLGVHTFYRPRAWGDGSDDPIWGSVPSTSKPGAGGAPSADAATPSGNAAAQGAAFDKPSRTAKL
jgi:spore germination cell wall hydrolase CwlJ-like protein